MKYKRTIAPIFMAILGLTLLLIPGTILTTVIRVVGALLVGGSIFYLIDIFKNNSPSLGLIYAMSIGILGVLIFMFPETIASIMPLVLGLWIILKSMFKLQLIAMLKVNGNKAWLKVLIVNLLMLIMGIVLVFNPFEGAELLVRIIGGFILVYALLDMFDFFITNPNKTKKVKVIK